MKIVIFLVCAGLSAVICGTIAKTENSGGCPKNSIHKECTNICPDKSCDNYQTVSGCFSLRCGPPGCMCKEGHVLFSSADKSKGCVPRETCTKLTKIQNAP